jgi:endonuclease NucS-like protein
VFRRTLQLVPGEHGGRAHRDARIPGWAQLATGWRLLDSDRMGAEVHLWRVAVGEQLIEIDRAPLSLESRLQDWLVRDISILDPGMLVIGREVETDFGGFIDILCIDAEGDLVIVELKRDRTPREVTAQPLDYASWVSALSNDR